MQAKDSGDAKASAGELIRGRAGSEGGMSSRLSASSLAESDEARDELSGSSHGLGNSSHGAERRRRLGSRGPGQPVSTGQLTFDYEGNATNFHKSGHEFRPYSPSEDKDSNPSAMLRRKSSEAIRASSRASKLGSSSSGDMGGMAAAAQRAIQAASQSEASVQRVKLLFSARVPRLPNPFGDCKVVCCQWAWTARQDVLRYLDWTISDYFEAEVDEAAIVAGTDESDPVAQTVQIAKAKAESIMGRLRKLSAAGTNRHSECYILTADQRVLDDRGRVLANPKSKEEANEFIMRFTNSAATTVSSVALTHFPSGEQVDGSERIKIHFQSLPRAIVSQLVENDSTETVLRSAGGLAVENPMLQKLIDRIEGTVDVLLGLPIQLTAALLARLEARVGSSSGSGRAESKESGGVSGGGGGGRGGGSELDGSTTAEGAGSKESAASLDSK